MTSRGKNGREWGGESKNGREGVGEVKEECADIRIC